jgi:hypothetical protein
VQPEGGVLPPVAPVPVPAVPPLPASVPLLPAPEVPAAEEPPPPPRAALPLAPALFGPGPTAASTVEQPSVDPLDSQSIGIPRVSQADEVATSRTARLDTSFTWRLRDAS